MDFWFIEIFNSFDDKNKDSLLTFFLSISISLFAYLIPAGWGKLDIKENRFALAKLVNEAFPRAIVGGVSFYVALIFLVRSSATDSLFRGMFILVGITLFSWIASLYFTARNQKTIEKKEAEYLAKKDKKLPVEFSIWRMLKWNTIIILIWIIFPIGVCLSKPLSDALNKNNPKASSNVTSTSNIINP